MSHPNKDGFGRVCVIGRITALGGTGKYDSKGHPPWHPVLGCAIPYHYSIPKGGWAEDAVLNCPAAMWRRKERLQLESSVRVVNQMHENARAGTVVGTLKVGDNQISQYCLKLGMSGFFLEVAYLFVIYLYLLYIYIHFML